MSRYTTPDHEGFFWGKLIHPREGTADGEDAKSTMWEVIDVFENYIGPDRGDGERLGAFVPGIAMPQWIEDFVWGPEVIKPKELK